ncbi:MAG: hypothetical protein JJT78_02485 [Leptospira sp.]|nr:hypothetical protein [Leptospira sp.]
MLTALLLLLGLSGAGAGLYSVLKEPKDRGEFDPSKDRDNSSGRSYTDVESDRPLPGPRESRGSQKSIGGGAGSPSGEGATESGSSSPGSRGGEAQNRKKNNFDEPENLPLGDYGGSDDDGGGANERNDFEPIGSPSVTYTADDIISKNSKFSHHRRPLINAENLVDKEKVNEALEIYKRTEGRISDPEIKDKIQQNIDDLKSHLKKKEKLEDLYNAEKEELSEPFREKLEELKSGAPIPLRDLAEAIREIAEALAEAMSKGFYPPPQQPGGQPYQPPQPQKSGALPPVGQPPPPDYGRKLPPDYFPAPIVYQVISAPGQPFDAKFQPPPTPPVSPQQPQNIQTQPPAFFPPNQNIPQQSEVPPLPHEEQETGLDYENLPPDTFFNREWDKFKDLPLTDRRSGKDRRQKKDRRTNLDRKDRRSGEDRRKVDLFKEREEYLKKKAEEKKAFQDGLSDTPPLSDQLQPFYPPWELPEIGLPEPEAISPDDKIFKLTPENVELAEIGLPFGETSRLDYGEASPDELSEGELPPAVDFKRDSDSKKELELPDPQDISLKGDDPHKLDLPPIEPPKIELPSLDFAPPEPSSESPGSAGDLPNINLPDAEEMRREMGADGPVLKPPVSGDLEDQLEDLEDQDAPDIEIVDGDLDDQLGEIETPDEEVEEEQEPEKILHGVLELKPPEVDDAPFLTLTYDFSKIPHGYRLSKNYSIMEYSYYKYKPMLMKAQEFARRKMLKNALNYYRVIKSQNIPPEMRKMINRNIQDITEFMEKFLMAKGS